MLLIRERERDWIRQNVKKVKGHIEKKVEKNKAMEDVRYERGDGEKYKKWKRRKNT